MPRSGPLISSAATLPSAEPSRVDNYPAFYTWFGKQPRGPDLEEREEPFLFRALDELLPRKVFPPRPSRVSSVDGRFNFPLPSSHHPFDDSTNFSTELGRKGALRAIRCIRGSQLKPIPSRIVEGNPLEDIGSRGMQILLERNFVFFLFFNGKNFVRYRWKKKRQRKGIKKGIFLLKNRRITWWRILEKEGWVVKDGATLSGPFFAQVNGSARCWPGRGEKYINYPWGVRGTPLGENLRAN